MNILKKGFGTLLIAGLILSCTDDDTSANPSGLGEIVLSSFSVEASGDGTVITVTPLSIGATSYTVDFGDPNSTTDVLNIEEQGGSVSYDYPNEEPEVTYTITVTAISSAGLASVSLSEDVTVVHVPAEGSLSTLAAAPTGSISNVFAIYTDGMEFNGGLLEYRWGEAASGGTAVTVGEENALRLSRLGSDAGVLSVSTVDPANAFGDGIGATHIHFDVYSDFAVGIDILKVTLVNEGATEEYEIDGLALADGAWASFDFDLATGFSAAVAAIDEITFELGAGGTANDHASIYVDNVYLYKATGATILNGDFEITGTFATSQWRFTTFTDGETNPFGSSSDGSDFDYDGVDTGDKTRGAKWSSSQAAGQLASASSRYAYQALNLTPDTDYVLEYQYAIDDDNDEIVGGRHLVGLVLNGHYIDGADAVDNVADNLGTHLGYYAEGKFNTTPNDYGTYVQIPFTSNATGEVAVMFYSVAPDDAWIDNVRITTPAGARAAASAFTSDTPGGDDYQQYTFTNNSVNGASFSWDFGDGNTSTDKSPTHTYAADGTYNVVLTATNSAGSNVSNEMITVSAPAVQATFAAVVLNSTADMWTTNTSDNADSWNMNPNSTIIDNTGTEVTSPYTWDNSTLDAWLEANCGDGSQQPGSTSDGNKFGQTGIGVGGRGVKINEACRRLYQPVTVEIGVEYTFTIDSRSEAMGVPSEVFILNTAIADETGLDANGASDASVDAYFLINNDFNSTKSSATEDTFTTTTFTFIPTTTEIIIYVRAPLAVDSSNEVFYDNIDIITPGF